MSFGPSYTHVHLKGNITRKDYVLIDERWTDAIRTSFVDLDVHLAVSRDDHFAVALVISLKRTVVRAKQSVPIPPYDKSKLDDPAVVSHLAVVSHTASASP